MSFFINVQGTSSPKALPRTIASRLSNKCRKTLRAKKPIVALSSRQATTERLLTKDDLIASIATGCKTRDKFKIGTEHEKLGFNVADCSRISYSQVKQLLRGLEKRFGWEPIIENDKIIALKKDGQSVTLEPSGQFELSGAPLDNLHQTCAEVNSHLYQVKTIAEEIGVGFLGIGVDPISKLEDVPLMPKARYDLMRSYMPKKGKNGLNMMLRTCTIQVNLDFESEADMIEKYRIGLALQPIAMVLFANSPFTERKPNGFVSLRNNIWTDTDPDRCGILPFVFEENFGFERYVDYVLDVPMYFIHRPEKGGYIDALGLSFRDFMDGKCPALPNEYPTMDDWNDHMTTVFPEVRLKTYLEMRGADGGPWRFICGLPAFWVGLLYDPVAQSKALDLISDWTQEERNYMYEQVAITGLKTPFRDGTVLDIARESLEICKGGLQRRGLDEMSFLKELEQIVETGMTQADVLLHKYHNEWNESVEPIYTEFCY